MLRLLPLLIMTIGCPDRQDWPDNCPNPGRADVHYMHDSWAERGRCATDDWACPQEDMQTLSERFPRVVTNDCGCGCFGVLDDSLSDDLD